MKLHCRVGRHLDDFIRDHLGLIRRPGPRAQNGCQEKAGDPVGLPLSCPSEGLCCSLTACRAFSSWLSGFVASQEPSLTVCSGEERLEREQRHFNTTSMCLYALLTGAHLWVFDAQTMGLEVNFKAEREEDFSELQVKNFCAGTGKDSILCRVRLQGRAKRRGSHAVQPARNPQWKGREWLSTFYKQYNYMAQNQNQNIKEYTLKSWPNFCPSVPYSTILPVENFSSSLFGLLLVFVYARTNWNKFKSLLRLQKLFY